MPRGFYRQPTYGLRSGRAGYQNVVFLNLEARDKPKKTKDVILHFIGPVIGSKIELAIAVNQRTSMIVAEARRRIGDAKPLDWGPAQVKRTFTQIEQYMSACLPIGRGERLYAMPGG